MVDYNGLENRRAERHRGFESLSLRKETLISNDLRNYKRNALNLHNSGRFHFYKPTTPTQEHEKKIEKGKQPRLITSSTNKDND